MHLDPSQPSGHPPFRSSTGFGIPYYTPTPRSILPMSQVSLPSLRVPRAHVFIPGLSYVKRSWHYPHFYSQTISFKPIQHATPSFHQHCQTTQDLHFPKTGKSWRLWHAAQNQGILFGLNSMNQPCLPQQKGSCQGQGESLVFSHIPGRSTRPNIHSAVSSDNPGQTETGWCLSMLQ